MIGYRCGMVLLQRDIGFSIDPGCNLACNKLALFEIDSRGFIATGGGGRGEGDCNIVVVLDRRTIGGEGDCNIVVVPDRRTCDIGE